MFYLRSNPSKVPTQQVGRVIAFGSCHPALSSFSESLLPPLLRSVPVLAVAVALLLLLLLLLILLLLLP